MPALSATCDGLDALKSSTAAATAAETLGAELARLSLHWFRRLRLVVLGLSAGALVVLTILLWDRRCDIREFGLVHCKISHEATLRTLNNTELTSRISVEKSLLADFLLVLLIFLL